MTKVKNYIVFFIQWLGDELKLDTDIEYEVIKSALDAYEFYKGRLELPVVPRYENGYVCPQCNELLYAPYESAEYSEYCPDCGQHIDWRNIDEICED